MLYSMIIVGLLLTGCNHDEKIAEQIYSNLEKSAQMEEKFAAKQQNLSELGHEEQAAYQEITSLTMDQENQVRKKLKEAQEYNANLKRTLNGTKESFDKAYRNILSVETNMEKIKAKEQKVKVSKIVQVMEKRHDLIENYYKKYENILKLNQNLYTCMQEKDINATEIDKQIKTINQAHTEMLKIEEQFNQFTAKYNAAKKQYYQDRAGQGV